MSDHINPLIGTDTDFEAIMNSLTIVNDTDFYRTPMIADATTRKRVRFEALQVPGKGWTIAKITGSRKTGRTIEVAKGFESCNRYTLAQAQWGAATLTRDIFRALRAR